MKRLTPLPALLWAKARISHHWIASVRHESKLKVGFVSVSAALLWLGAFGFCLGVLYLFDRFGALNFGDTGTVKLSDLVMDRLLSLMALTFFALLVVSNILVSFATLYRAKEVAYLVQSPITISTFFLGRFVECVSFSSWALAFLGSPALLAYGLHRDASPWFYLALVAFYLPFVCLPAAIGSSIAMLLVRLFAGRRRSALVGTLLIAAAVMLGFLRSRVEVPEGLDQAETVQAVLDIMGQAQAPLLPSFWLSEGLLAAARPDLGQVLFYWLVLVANALLLVWLATLAAEAWFYRGWTQLMAADEGRAPVRARSLLGVVDRIGTLLPEPTRSLVVKDVKLFWRDPAQWTQFLIFFGIMAIYVANLHPGGAIAGSFRRWVGLLNVTASMLILATLTTRFIFPLISLEGRRFWIVGMAPLSKRLLMRQKFLLSVGCTSVITLGLCVLSGLRLELTSNELLLSVVCVAATTIALSGLAVGLGSLYPNFQEDNPARITSGLGGTLNFILSLGYIVLITTAQVFVMQWQRDAGADRQASIAVLIVFILMLTAVTGWVPMRLGLRNLERAEF